MGDVLSFWWTNIIKRSQVAWCRSCKNTVELELEFVPKGNKPWIFIGRADTEAEAPILWPPCGRSWFFVKDLDAGKRLKAKGEGGDRGWDSVTNSMDLNLSKFWEIVDTGVWCATVHGVTKNQTRLSDWELMYVYFKGGSLHHPTSCLIISQLFCEMVVLAKFTHPWHKMYAHKDLFQIPAAHSNSHHNPELSETFCHPPVEMPYHHLYMSLSKNRETWCAVVHGVTKNWTQLSNWTATI